MAYIYDKVRVGNRIRKIRQKLGWTQEQAAERIEKSLIFYSRIELGQTGMSFQTLLDICSAFGVTPDEILLEPHSDETLANVEWIARRMTARTGMGHALHPKENFDLEIRFPDFFDLNPFHSEQF